MLNQLHLENFKAWKTLDIKFGRVTGLFGTNSSGKSSILQFLLLLKQTKDATDRGLVLDFGGTNQLVNLGSYKDVIHHHQENLPLKWVLGWSNERVTSQIIVYKNRQMKKTRDFDSKLEVSNFLFGQSEYNNMYYIAPLREYPKREYQWSGASPSSVGYYGENTINAILSATIRNETRTIPNQKKEKPFQEVIAYWLKELGLIQEFSVKEIAPNSNLYRAVVKKEQGSADVFLTDVGFGVSQVLPALVLLYYVPQGSIILMEQPEIHLHPSVQSGLADVILQVSKQRNIQVIVESHSEHLLRRFQRRIAEEEYSAEDLKLYFCDSHKGESTLSDLKINEFGEIENYPENFFGDEMAEISATRKAALKRKMEMARDH